MYAATKLHQEHLCEASRGRLTSASVRFAITTSTAPGCRGTRRTLRGQHLPQRVRTGTNAVRCTIGAQRRISSTSPTVALANEAALLAPVLVDGPFNVATGEVHTVADLAQTLGDAYGPDRPDAVVTGAYRLADVRHVTASPGRARRWLGFRGSIPFERGMAEFATAELRVTSLGG